MMLRTDQCWRCDTICPDRIYCDKCKLAYYCSDACKGSDEFRHQVDCHTARLKRKCSSCGKKSTELQQCGSCLRAWYCNQECLKKAWPTHKVACQQVTKKTNDLCDKVRDLFAFRDSARLQGMGTVYYWGNIPATDFINLPLNEGRNYSKPLSVLVSGVGDPRNVVLSLAQLSESYEAELTFVLNDICACTLARTVLILYLLLKGRSKLTFLLIINSLLRKGGETYGRNGVVERGKALPESGERTLNFSHYFRPLDSSLYVGCVCWFPTMLGLISICFPHEKPTFDWI